MKLTTFLVSAVLALGVAAIDPEFALDSGNIQTILRSNANVNQG
jgi:hypothetical protein